ncbi:MAG: IS66 family insertion sequence element accessory protein TnpA [Thermodesulfobacteriota bacterium]
MSTELSENSSTNKEKIWKAHIKACSQSGLTRKEYCRRHSLSYHAFYYWKKKLFPQCRPMATVVMIS